MDAKKFIHKTTSTMSTPNTFVRRRCTQRRENITQYKRLARDAGPEVQETWQTGFGKDIERMAQGDNKTKTKGKNYIFVMNHTQIKKIYAEGKTPTYARIVVDF